MNTDPEFISDEELSFIEWLRNSDNKLTIAEVKHQERLIKYCFTQGFAAGYTYKNTVTSEEILQK